MAIGQSPDVRSRLGKRVPPLRDGGHEEPILKPPSEDHCQMYPALGSRCLEWDSLPESNFEKRYQVGRRSDDYIAVEQLTANPPKAS